jgi:hypothetical protein
LQQEGKGGQKRRQHDQTLNEYDERQHEAKKRRLEQATAPLQTSQEEEEDPGQDNVDLSASAFFD